MKNILYIGGFELPDKNAAAHRVISISKIFKSLGYNVTLIGVNKKRDFLEKHKILGFDSYEIKYPKGVYEWFKYLTNISHYKKIINNSKKFDMIILYNFPGFAGYKINKLCKKNNIKCVGDITEWYSTNGRGIIFKILKKIDNFLRMNIVNKKSDGLIVISEYLKKYYKNSNNVINIPPLIDINDKKWKIDNKNENTDSIKLLYCGNPGKKDRLDFVINGLNNCKLNYIFNILGITKQQYSKLYKINKDDINDNVFFHGRKTHIETLKFLKNSDFLIFYRENSITNNAGFPTKFVEATTCGVPVITNLTSDLKFYVKDKINGIILENYKSISKLSNIDSKKIIYMKSKINKNTFDYRNYIKKTEKWLNKLISK